MIATGISIINRRGHRDVLDVLTSWPCVNSPLDSALCPMKNSHCPRACWDKLVGDVGVLPHVARLALCIVAVDAGPDREKVVEFRE